MPYHKYVFRDGKFVGEFENMYQQEAVEGFDSWHQDAVNTPFHDTLIEVIKRYGPYKRILDLGCGKGAFTNRVRNEIGGDITAIDISPTAIEKARTRYAGIDFRVSDIGKVSFEEDFFDLIIIVEVFWYILKDIATILEKIKMCLSDKGYFFTSLSFPDRPIGKEVFPNKEAFTKLIKKNFAILELAEMEDHIIVLARKNTKKLLLCATDAGGARNLAPLLLYVQNKGFLPSLITSEGMLALFDTRGIKIIKAKDVNSEMAAINLLKEISPAAIVCGTTRYTGPERLLITAARKLGIKSVVILDEWFNYRIRFQKEDGELSYLPDIICCQDEKSRNEAASEGIPPDHLFVTGSAFLSTLTFRAEKFLTDPPAMPGFIKDKTKPIITFLHETHSLDYGLRPGESGPLGQFIGYSEHTVRQDIFDTLKKIGKNCTVIEKLHPAYQGYGLAPLGDSCVQWITVPTTDLLPLLWHSDLVVGMRSIVLLEAAILGCPAVSYQPHLIGPQVCAAVRFNLIKSIHDKDGLYDWFKKNISSELKRGRRLIQRLPFLKDGVLQNVTDLINAK